MRREMKKLRQICAVFEGGCGFGSLTRTGPAKLGLALLLQRYRLIRNRRILPLVVYLVARRQFELLRLRIPGSDLSDGEGFLAEHRTDAHRQQVDAEFLRVPRTRSCG